MSGGHNINATTNATHPDLVLCTIDVGRRYLAVGRKFVMSLVEFPPSIGSTLIVASIKLVLLE